MLRDVSNRMEDVEMNSPFKSPVGGRRLHLPYDIHNTPSPGSSTRHRHHSGERSSGSISDENEPPGNVWKSANSSFNGEARVNPFEKDVLAGLQTSFWSPSIMETKSTPPQSSWAIEHLSNLFPKDFENSPSTHQNAFLVDAQTEAKAQADIDMYFSKGQIVPTPSPMKQRVQNGLPIDQVNVTKTRVHLCSQESISMHSPIARGISSTTGLPNAFALKKIKVKPMTERWTQTALSFPQDLPPHLEQLLSQFTHPNSDLCGSSTEVVTYYSQQSDASEHTEGDNYDSGKNSTSLNNSLRRRLDLSFGDDPEGEDSQGLSQSPPPNEDPFRRNHIVSTPPNPSRIEFNTTTSEIEVQLLRCEFTPESRGAPIAMTPGITPITDEPDEPRFDVPSSTPKRQGISCNFKRLAVNAPLSPVAGCSTSVRTEQSVFRFPTRNTETESDIRVILRRSRTSDSTNSKVSSASSFDDSQLLMDESSPPAKLSRRNSSNNDS